MLSNTLQDMDREKLDKLISLVEETLRRIDQIEVAIQEIQNRDKYLSYPSNLIKTGST